MSAPVLCVCARARACVCVCVCVMDLEVVVGIAVARILYRVGLFWESNCFNSASLPFDLGVGCVMMSAY